MIQSILKFNIYLIKEGQQSPIIGMKKIQNKEAVGRTEETPTNNK